MRRMYSQAYILELINKGISTKQDTLVSGLNIKTINNNSILGSGNLVIAGGGGAGDSVEPAEFSSSNTQLNGLTINGTDYKLLDVKANDGSSLIIGNNRSLKNGASQAVAIGDCAYSMASGDYSTTLGYSSMASGYGSTAIGRYSTASGSDSIALGYASTASGIGSTALGNNTAVYVLNWVSFDGTSDSLVRTLALKSTDNVFFRNENIDVSKTTQASYTSGKTLTEVLSEKQDTLVSGTNIKTIGGVSVLGSGNIPAYDLPTASKTTLGGVKVDGTTITITNGVISANFDTTLYGASLSLTDTTLTLKNTAGTGISSVTLPTGLTKVTKTSFAVGDDMSNFVDNYNNCVVSGNGFSNFYNRGDLLILRDYDNSDGYAIGISPVTKLITASTSKIKSLTWIY